MSDHDKQPLWIVHVQTPGTCRTLEYKQRADSREAAEAAVIERKRIDSSQFDVWTSWKCDCGC
jgi:hypothetical protein